MDNSRPSIENGHEPDLNLKARRVEEGQHYKNQRGKITPGFLAARYLELRQGTEDELQLAHVPLQAEGPGSLVAEDQIEDHRLRDRAQTDQERAKKIMKNPFAVHAQEF